MTARYRCSTRLNSTKHQADRHPGEAAVFRVSSLGAAPAGPLGLMPCAPAELARGVRLAPVPARRPGRGRPDTPRTFHDDRMPSPGGQVSEMAEKARTLRPCVA
jgi:hypothetical protein